MLVDIFFTTQVSYDELSQKRHHVSQVVRDPKLKTSIIFSYLKDLQSVSLLVANFLILVWVHLVCDFSDIWEKGSSDLIGLFLATHAQTKNAARLDGEPKYFCRNMQLIFL